MSTTPPNPVAEKRPGGSGRRPRGGAEPGSAHAERFVQLLRRQVAAGDAAVQAAVGQKAPWVAMWAAATTASGMLSLMLDLAESLANSEDRRASERIRHDFWEICDDVQQMVHAAAMSQFAQQGGEDS